MLEHIAKVAVVNTGRQILPAPFRKALGLTGAGQVVPSLEGDEVGVTSVGRRLLDARTRFRRSVPPGQRMAAALLEERRAEEAQAWRHAASARGLSMRLIPAVPALPSAPRSSVGRSR